MKSTSVLLSLALISGIPALQAQSFRVERNAPNESKRAAKRPNVLRELKLSAAQREEIATIVSSLRNDTRTIRRKKDMLKEDYTMAALKEPQDEKEMLRIQSDMQATQAEINAMALKKMAEIKALLSKTQLAKLNDLRATERERLIAQQKNDQGDQSVDNRPKIPAVQSFTMQSFSMGSEEKLFNADEVFVYPDRDLWMDNGAMGNFSFSTNEDGDIFGQPFENFFGGNGNGFHFQMPNFQRFQQNQSDDDGSDLMDENSPFTLPKDRRAQPAPDESSMRQQLEEMRNKLKKMEKQLDDKKQSKPGSGDDK